MRSAEERDGNLQKVFAKHGTVGIRNGIRIKASGKHISFFEIPFYVTES